MATKNPNAMLRRIRSSVMTLSRGGAVTAPPALQDLIQAVKDLDNHLSWGGTPPDEWAGASFHSSATRGQEPHPVEDLMRRM